MLKEASSFFAIAFILFVGAYVYICSQGGNPNALFAPHVSQAQPLNYHQLAREDAQHFGISADLFERQINQESGFNPKAVSPAGAIGIAQIMPATAQSWGVDPYNPVQSLSVAADHMSWYVNHYGGDYAKALAAYNAGTSTLDAAIARYGSHWRVGVPAETNRYITAIMGV
jgi:soluble lytic murein transglycosylase-like protein